MKKFSLSARSRYGAVSILISIVVVVAIILANVVVSSLTDRLGWRVDMTEDSTYEISDESLSFVGSLDKSVNIHVLSSESAFNTVYNELVLKYQAANKRVSVSYVDIIKNPDFAKDYPDENLTAGGILVECEGRTRFISSDDFLSYYVNNEETTQEDALQQYYYYGTQYETKLNIEFALTLAIKKVVAKDIPGVAFITNHKEMVLNEFGKLLEQNGYDTQNIDLDTVTKIPDGIDYVIISAPSADYTANEIKMLDNYLLGQETLGKNIVYLAGPSQPDDLPNLEALLKEWGVLVGDGTVYETDVNNMFRYTQYGSPAAMTTFSNTDLASGISKDESSKTVMYAGRPLSCAYKENGSYTASTLISFSDTTKVTKSGKAAAKSDKSGPFDAMILSQYVKFGGETGTTRYSSNIFTVSSAYFLNKDFLSVSGISNGKYSIELFNETLGLDYGLNIEAKSLEGTKFDVTAGEANTLGIIFIGVVPVIVLVSGLIVYFRRRHL